VSLEGRVLGVSFNAIVGDAMWMDISEYGNPKNLSVKEWAEEDGFRDKHKWILREWKTTVGGNNAYCFFYSKPAGFSQATFIENGDKMCILTFGVSAGLDDHNGKFLESWLSKILSTFKVLG
ncbi:hypothetical protein L6258_03670, partial [Candidatus Parcubacteria bacterium]|nr:hypothetical protein [Candidatus Parcubacteria bacterium]